MPSCSATPTPAPPMSRTTGSPSPSTTAAPSERWSSSTRNWEMDGDVLSTLKLNSRTPVLMDHDITLMYEVGLQLVEELSTGTIPADDAAQLTVARERVQELAAKVAYEVVADSAVHNCAG